MMVIGNVSCLQRIRKLVANEPTQYYVIAAIAIVGGGLFGFDISSMSAM